MKILFGIKHRQALQNVFAIASFLKSKNQIFDFKLICFFELNNQDLKNIRDHSVGIISVPNNFIIKGDEKKVKFFSVVKLLKFHNFLIKNDTTISKNDSLIISPGGFLLDHLVAYFAFKNKSSYILQNGFISISEKVEEKNKRFSKFSLILSIFFKAYKIRQLINKKDSKITYLTFNDEYTNFINKSENYNNIAKTVGSPRFRLSQYKNVLNKYDVLYLGSSALYENNIFLHELIKNQILKLSQLFSNKNYNLNFRPHPRDGFNWYKYLTGYHVNILNSNDKLEDQIEENGFIVSERSTVVIQAILSNRIGFWVPKDRDLIYDYEYITCPDEISMLKVIEKCNLNDDNYKYILNKQLKILKNRIISSYGEEASKNIVDIIQKDLTRNN